MGMLIGYLIEGFFALGFVLASIIEMVLIFKDGFQMMPFIGSVIALIIICMRMTIKVQEKGSLELFEQVVGLTLVVGLMEIPFLMALPQDIMDDFGMFGIMGTAVMSQPCKCLVGYLISSTSEVSIEANLQKKREYLHNYYRTRIIALERMEKLIDKNKCGFNTSEKLVNLLACCGSTKLKSVFQKSDANRNAALINKLKDELTGVGLSEIISEDMTISKIREEIKKQIVSAQEKSNRFQTAQYREIQSEYKSIIKLDKTRKYEQLQRIKKIKKKLAIVGIVMMTIAFGSVITIYLYNVHKEKVIAEEKETIYVEALEFQKQKDYIKANELFESILGYRNVDELIEKQKFDVERQRILTARLGDVVTLGRCNDGDLEIDGEIKWIVLAEENGKKLIVSENVLAHKKYHQTLKEITWEASDLREWLNTNFYAKFFTEQEKTLISENLLKNKNNSSNNIEAGNDTVDKIFVLSFYEANRYFASTEKRSMKDWWWLRTPGTKQNRATIVTEGGYLLATGKDVDKIGGVRPAMWAG